MATGGSEQSRAQCLVNLGAVLLKGKRRSPRNCLLVVDVSPSWHPRGASKRYIRVATPNTQLVAATAVTLVKNQSSCNLKRHGKNRNEFQLKIADMWPLIKNALNQYSKTSH